MSSMRTFSRLFTAESALSHLHRRLAFLLLPLPLLAMLLVGCTPTWNWREVRGTPIAFTVLLPAKPSTHARKVNLDGTEVTMTMTAAEVEGTTFAVGTAELPAASQTEKALQAMKTALVRNINGTIKKESAYAAGDAHGIQLEAEGKGRHLALRLVARDRFVYQVLVAGRADAVNQESTDTFLSSFKPR